MCDMLRDLFALTTDFIARYLKFGRSYEYGIEERGNVECESMCVEISEKSFSFLQR